jgi:hypothetical protein
MYLPNGTRAALVAQGQLNVCRVALCRVPATVAGCVISKTEKSLAQVRGT